MATVEMNFTKKEGPISIVYGVEESGGVYLNVKDERLAVSAASSDEVNSVAMTNSLTEDGCYLSIRTGKGESKVSKDVMNIYLKRYGVGDEEISRLFDQEIADKKQRSQICSTCLAISAQFRCGKCKSINYCSQDCQKSNWGTHKLFCQAWPFPTKPQGKLCINAVLLPENDEFPRFVTVFFHETMVDGEPFYIPAITELLNVRGRDQQGRALMNHNARRSKKPLDEKFEFAFRDNFLNDGSKQNKCVKNLTRGKAPHDWRGPIVVLKFQLQEYSEKYLDMTMEDTTQIIDFLLEYGSREAPLPDFLKDFTCMRL